MQRPPIRVLVAKPGLDGHDKGAKVVVQALRNAGMEVIYTGLHRTVEEIVSAAVQEDVEVIGLSIMSGAYMPICRKLVQQLAAHRMTDVLLVVGGVILQRDIESLRALGFQGVFPVGSTLEEIVTFIKDHAPQR